MKIIGVELHTPSLDELSVLAAISLIYIVAAFLLDNLAIMQTTTLAYLLVGAVSGSLATSCGCSIPKYGVRGAILTLFFCIAMMGLCSALTNLIKLF
ncbi:hypothetical protein E4188_22225 (plasmid) [Aeromonas media]|uniref:Uncharacterized protein n=1 Tax=Aeromonas media TaxID=651 RepID=A0ABX6NXU7_AERME|nr:hypothetical protein [Aeromonas media]QJT37017.1 hypothetical protein E4187_22245 [Aeromonas media]QJT41219.1 hypothetical protein E4188_22225 [Aeromonas media]